jgi:hypothetical protein
VIPRVYIDSCWFIEAARFDLTGTTSDPDRENEVAFLKAILEASRDGEVDVFTSTLTLAECLHVDGCTDPTVQDLYRGLLSSGRYVTLVQPDVFVCEDARLLRWHHGIAMSGADGVHVASAIAMRCTEFLTCDGKISSYGDKIAAAYGLRVLPPSGTDCLGEERLQPNLLDGLDDESEE